VSALARRLKGLAEDVGAALLALMFATFLVQIGSRYVFNAPASWTLEACLTLWLWVVFWGCAFVLGERDHVRFDVLYVAVSRSMRRAFALVSALAIAGGMLAALPATWSYVTFYEIKRSAVIGIRLDVVFSIYLVFAVAIIARYIWRARAIVRGGDPDVEERANP
jgi:TRAP-type C4-dicarboxylate transport system permease small subunit